jgi:hypothetical protein
MRLPNTAHHLPARAIRWKAGDMSDRFWSRLSRGPDDSL